MKKLTGLFAAVALMSSGMALANEGKQQDKQQTQGQSGTGGAGSQGSDHGMSETSGSLGGAGQSGSTQGTGSDIGGSGSQTGSQTGTSGSSSQTGTSGSGSSMGTGSGSTTGSGTQVGQSGQSGMTDSLAGNQITGRVVKSDRKTVWVEHAGAIVPLKVDKNTQFGDPSMKRASDLKEGDEIRASFEVRKTDNVATSIEKNTDLGQGGSGSDAMMPDQGINDTLPPSNDIGGSGGDLGPDITNQGSDLGTGSDVNQGNKASGDF